MLITNFRFKYYVYRIVNGFFQGLDVGILHPLRERGVRALKQTVDFIEKEMPKALGFETQKEITEYSLKQITVDGYCLEFGVYEGGTIRFIARKLGLKTKIHGFDSFEGLPEVWGGFSMDTDSFNVGGNLPKVPENVILHKGWFDQTLPKWVSEFSGPIAFIHIDCDIYSSTKTIFDFLKEKIVPGTVILFDEFFNYPGWELHEYKAFMEYVNLNNVEFEYLAYARQQVAVKIKNTG